MEKRRKVVVVALIGIAIASLVLANFVSALSSRGAGRSGVFAKVYGWAPVIYFTTEWEVLLNITLPYIPISAYYYVVCDGYVYWQRDPTVGIAIGVDSATADENTSRYYRGGDGFHFNSGIHTERVYYLDPGVHTFYLLGQIRYEGYAKGNRFTITVIVFTDGSLTEP